MSAQAGTLWFEDVEINKTTIFGSHHFTREAIIAFAKKYDPQDFHLNDEAAAASHFGRLCASGWHSCAGFMKTCAAYNFAIRDKIFAVGATLPPLGPSPGFEDLQWLKPVYAGDTITYRSTVLRKREMATRLGWGLIFSLNEGHNQHGELVLSFKGKLLMPIKATTAPIA